MYFSSPPLIYYDIKDEDVIIKTIDKLPNERAKFVLDL